MVEGKEEGRISLPHNILDWTGLDWDVGRVVYVYVFQPSYRMMNEPLL